MNLEKDVPQSWRRSKWFWPVIASICIVVTTVTVVPLAVILPRRNEVHHPSTSVIIPLYVYPLNDSSWGPVYDAVSRRPDLNFTIIVNPNSGPGDAALPDPRYVSAVQRLNSYPNIETIGYVRTGYASRNLSDVTHEVGVYSGWSANSSSLAMHGIFFDEAPHEYSAEAVEFLRAADKFAKNAPGLLGRKTVVHNPGVVPDSRFNSTDVDITVIFEETFAVWQNLSVKVASLPKTRSTYSIMINSVPNMSNSTMSEFVDTVSDLAKYLFITSLSVNFYNSFATDLLEFVGQVPA